MMIYFRRTIFIAKNFKYCTRNDLVVSKRVTAVFDLVEIFSKIAFRELGDFRDLRLKNYSRLLGFMTIIYV